MITGATYPANLILFPQQNGGDTPHFTEFEAMLVKKQVPRSLWQVSADVLLAAWWLQLGSPVDLTGDRREGESESGSLPVPVTSLPSSSPA